MRAILKQPRLVESLAANADVDRILLIDQGGRTARATRRRRKRRRES